MKHLKRGLLFFMLLCITVCPAYTVLAKSKKKPMLRLTTPKHLTVEQKKTYKLHVKAVKVKHTKIRWKSSNSRVVSVSKSGKIKAKTHGKAKITAYVKTNKKIRSSCTVYVGKKVKKIKIKKSSKTLEPKQIYRLKTSISPRRAAYKKLKYSSSNSRIASVSATGIVKARKCGSCTIKVSSADGTNIKTLLHVTVTIRAKKLYFSESVQHLTVGESLRFLPKISPVSTQNKRLKFSSTNPHIVTVSSNGTVKAQAPGSVYVTSMSTDGSHLNASYKIYVHENPWNLKLSISKLNIISSYGDSHAFHPKVQNFSKPWNGYKYWMAYTPYPGADQTKENPHIAVSNNKVDWTTPEGMKNPLDPLKPFEDPQNQYNSDTHLVYRADLDTLECYYRQVDNNRNTDTLFKRTTTDGLHWTDRVKVLSTNTGQDGLLSPAIVYEDGKYKMWTVNYTSDYPILYRESEDGFIWTSPRIIKIPYENKNLRNWHLDVIHTDNGYEMLISAFFHGDNHLQMNLYYSHSNNNIDYSTPTTVLKPSSFPKAWDNRGIYRSCFFKENNNYYVFYSGIGYPKGINGSRGVGLTVGPSISDLKGYDQ